MKGELLVISDDFKPLSRRRMQQLLDTLQPISAGQARYERMRNRRAGMGSARRLPWHKRSWRPNGPYAYEHIDRQFAQGLRERMGMDRRRQHGESMKHLRARLAAEPIRITGFGGLI